MIKKIASIFKKKELAKSKLNFEKKEIAVTSEGMFEEFFHRSPGFPLGLPVIPVERLIQENDKMIKEIILARGMSGPHNKAEVEAKTMSPIRHLAEMTHLLPASEKKHYKLPGGLFAFCLEVSLFSIRYAERRILTRATPEIRKEYESLWAHAAFLTGLFSEAITAISKLSVYAEDIGIEWHPGTESLYEWIQRNNLKRYHIRWSEKEDQSMIYILAGKAIENDQAKILAQGEKAIYKTLLAALHEQTDFSNPLAKINDKVKYKIMERDEWSYAERYGKPLAGMHLEPWLIDAMRHLVQKKRWFPNEENGRIWHGQDGVYLVWPLAATDMQYQLKASECPFVPSTQEILAEIMLDAGIIESSSGLGGYLFDIEVPMAESGEKKHFEALKMARYEILFIKTQHKPIDSNLQIHLDQEDDEEPGDDEHKDKLDEKEIETERDEVPKRSSKEHLKSVNVAKDITGENCQTTSATESIGEEQRIVVENIDTSILFGKQENPIKPADVEITGIISEPKPELDPDLEAVFNGEQIPSTVNKYDDDYVAAYQSDKEIGYQEFDLIKEGKSTHSQDSANQDSSIKQSASVSSKKQEIEAQKDNQSFEKNEASTIQKESLKSESRQSYESTEKLIKKQASVKSADTQRIPQEPTADLLETLISRSKNKEKARPKKPQEEENRSAKEVDGLFGKSQNSGNSDQSGRATLILSRLKRGCK